MVSRKQNTMNVSTISKIVAIMLLDIIATLTCFFLGLCLSYLFSTPAGASVVVVNILCFLLFALLGKLRQR